MSKKRKIMFDLGAPVLLTSCGLAGKIAGTRGDVDDGTFEYIVAGVDKNGRPFSVFETEDRLAPHKSEAEAQAEREKAARETARVEAARKAALDAARADARKAWDGDAELRAKWNDQWDVYLAGALKAAEAEQTANG
jgi:multidrug efflux pump subunit AcrA (membrane-fusion protein)